MAKKTPSIDDTALAPYVIADGVVMEVIRALDGVDAEGAKRAFNELSNGSYIDYADALGGRAERLYQENGEFRKKLNAKGDAGRDTLYAFMRHWVSAMVRNDYGDDALKALPPGFAIGAEPPEPSPRFGR